MGKRKVPGRYDNCAKLSDFLAEIERAIRCDPTVADLPVTTESDSGRSSDGQATVMVMKDGDGNRVVSLF
jgi:hypothetical protein